jgi:hypothetical protein
MALPSSGPLSFNDIRIELSVPTQAPFGLDEAENGTYAVINQCSPEKPSSANPAQILEWYGYNHTATASVFLTNAEGSAETSAAACALAQASSWTLYVVGTIYYRDSICNTLLNQFYRNSTSTNWYQFSNGVLTDSGACTTTTTTTSTTTAACTSFNYAVVGSLQACNTGDWPNVGGQTAGFGNGAFLYAASNCRGGGISDTYIQTSDGINYELSSGIIQTSNNPFC